MTIGAKADSLALVSTTSPSRWIHSNNDGEALVFLEVELDPFTFIEEGQTMEVNVQ